MWLSNNLYRLLREKTARTSTGLTREEATPEIPRSNQIQRLVVLTVMFHKFYLAASRYATTVLSTPFGCAPPFGYPFAPFGFRFWSSTSPKQVMGFIRSSSLVKAALRSSKLPSCLTQLRRLKHFKMTNSPAIKIGYPIVSVSGM